MQRVEELDTLGRPCGSAVSLLIIPNRRGAFQGGAFAGILVAESTGKEGRRMKRYYRVGELAKLYGVSPDLLRYYEEQDLLRPQIGRAHV